MKVAYLGPAGTFGEEAARQFAPDAELVACPSHAAVAKTVESGGAALGVMAIENSINGSVAETLDILIHETLLQIQHELLVPIEHNLVAKPGVAIDAVAVIYSHTQALGQCREYLEGHFPDARLEAALSTAQAVELAIAHADAAAIANARAAALYGAEVLAKGIQDRANNATRFVVIGEGQPAASGRDRTSIAFQFDDDRAGLLTAAMTEFSDRRINCTKMESRPTRATFGEYIFLVDFEGHADDAACADALTALRAMTSELKIFGSYPRAAGA